MTDNDPIHRAAEVDVEYRADVDGGSGAIDCYAAIQVLLPIWIPALTARNDVVCR